MATTDYNAGRYTRQLVRLVDATTNTTNTTWVAGDAAALGVIPSQVWKLALNFPNIPGFIPSSLVRLHYYVPCRNQITTIGNWGGMYFEPQVSYNGGVTWASLGSCGYDGGVMTMRDSVSSFCNTILLDPQATTQFGVQIRIYAKPYSTATSVIAGINRWVINDLAGYPNLAATAPLASGTNGTQHFAHIIVEELALVRGSV